MIKLNQIGYLTAGAVIRYILITSNFFNLLSNRVEISTPINSYKKIQEGIYLYNNGIDPYIGDMVHETPTLLITLAWFHNNLKQFLPILYIICDLLTAFLFKKVAENFIKENLKIQKHNKYAPDTEDIQYNTRDEIDIPNNIMIAYLFNPFSIANCCGLTSTAFSNLFLSLYFYFLSKKQLIPSLIFLSLETTRSFYPFILISPILITFSNTYKKGTFITILFIVLCSGWSMLNYTLNGNWSFFDSTIGMIFFFRDLQPNIGLFWYFFTEMFDHFRTMFLITFQMNATVLYLIPLTLKLRKDPILLGTILITLITIFKSYPCFGDVALYLSLLPLWKKCWKFMAHNFIVFCFFIVTISIAPALWHLWIYSGSANANFYFGTTLAFSTGQIFLVTDLLFAYVKKDFCLKNGQKIIIDGKEAKVLLE